MLCLCPQLSKVLEQVGLPPEGDGEAMDVDLAPEPQAAAPGADAGAAGAAGNGAAAGPAVGGQGAARSSEALAAALKVVVPRLPLFRAMLNRLMTTGSFKVGAQGMEGCLYACV